MEGEDYKHSSMEDEKKEMFDSFYYWAVQNYGDSGKTKTVTRKKYQRITDILTGDEPPTAGNSKFRFWVKGKGFRVGPEDGVNEDKTCLYVPTKPITDTNSNDTNTEYKRVAIVEDFFDIIYSVHVEMDGRGGKHAGQKRTYRAIAEKYAFLPREAVTRFLMSCSDCQKRMHLSSSERSNTESPSALPSQYNPVYRHEPDLPGLPIVDFTLPITQTYLNHLKSRNLACDDMSDEESMSVSDSVVSEHSPASEQRTSTPVKCTPSENGDSTNGPVNLSTPKSSRSTDSPMEEDKMLNLSSISKSPIPRNDRKRRASDDSSVESSTKTSEVEIGDDQDGKDDDDENDDDDDEKIPVGKEIDPERLKAFNMFVRLFVDENLDRMVPISKQPKDKVQAILEACDRQFPEFHERSRKRIRTYLKSCRRMRRTKEQNGWEPLRPTPPHLTSAAAESLLSTACENESNNAKRMRMGLEPLPASVMNAARESSNNQSQSQSSQPTSTSQSTPTAHKQTTPPPTSTIQATQSRSSPAPQPTSTPQTDRHSTSSSDFLRHQPPPPAFRAPPEFHSPFFPNGNGLFRPGFPPTYQHPAHHHPTVLSHSPITQSSVQNGPTDLSLKKNSSKNQLSSSEITTIKQLIAGYRESAAFLYRSADELEQLLLQQN